jgi:hypothetical protein
MRFYNQPHRFYAGIDLHARTLFVCVLDQDGQIVFHENLAAKPDQLLAALEPFRDDLVVACECMFAWYWVADLCATHKIDFVLGQGRRDRLVVEAAPHAAEGRGSRLGADVPSRTVAFRERAREEERLTNG